VDRGPWTVDRGPWTVDRGPWTVDRGPWTVDRGPWTLDLDSIELFGRPQMADLVPAEDGWMISLPPEDSQGGCLQNQT
jgi:hypothetical protein